MAISAKSLSFSFNKFYANELDLDLIGNATTENNVLQLTSPALNQQGVALFRAPVRLWDIASALVTSFETTFTFVITGSDNIGNNLIFFMESADGTIFPPNSVDKYRGIFDPNGARAGVLAVEFDTFANSLNLIPFGPDGTTPWNRQSGRVATAYISYNSASKRLAVATAYPGGDTVTLSCDLDTTVLPEWVRVGFYASTGSRFAQETAIHSWSFTSTLIDMPQVEEGN